MKHLTIALTLTLLVCSVALAHNGNTFLVPSVPDPASMVIDGLEDDWGWYPEEFAILPDQIESWGGQFVGTGPGGQGDDFQASYFMAWSLPPDNNFYFFTRVFDDTLKSEWGENMRNWWDDDGLKWGVDADHTGGPHGVTGGENGIEQTLNGYVLGVNMPFSAELGLDYGGILGEEDHPNGDWPGLPPYGYVGIELLPPNASHGSENVEFTWEIKTILFDSYDATGPEGPDNIIHQFVPDGVIGTTPRYTDFDAGSDTDQPSRNFYGHAGGILDSQADGDLQSDFITILTHNPDDFPQPTAVENTTWARIKGLQAAKGLIQ
jgi:hypothetical protein